ncbi:AsmA family protein [Pelagibius litoralis]|uniref:AsmA family protein n=1 Tax=Pelagibius litoralis TaxID=374515 RepID=A0A967C515_9PROT|nr:AsmA family protein [Pelagibius litoralis]NIA68580.1 AsmA family protein [Pelagibius litoralis]
MKKLALTVAAILVLLTAGLLILPSFWDWNSEKGRISAEVRKLTGRDLEIVGDVSLRLLPSPAFSAGEVSLANIDGASSAKMIQIEELRIQVALFPLLQGQVLVETVTLVKPEVVLEVLPDGRRNWEFETLAQASEGGDPPASRPDSEPSGSDGAAESIEEANDAIRVDSFIIENGTLLYRDAANGLEERLTGLNAELAADSLTGPFVASGSAAYQDIQGSFDLSLDRLRESGATGFSLVLRLPKASASAQFAGALLRHQGRQTLRGRLQAQGENLAEVAALLTTKGAAPAGFLAQPFGLATEITAGPEEAQAEAMKLTLGEIDLEGDGKAVLGETPEVSARLSAKRLDLDSLLSDLLPSGTGQGAQNEDAGPAPAAPTDAADSPPRADRAEPKVSAFVLPDNVTANLELAVDTLVYRGQFARELQAAATLRDGKVTVETLTASLPGGSELALTGTLSSVAQAPVFEGELEATADNLRALLAWLDVDIEAVPADRLRKMALKTSVDARPQQLTLRDIDLRLDVSRMTGGIALALRDRPGLGVGLAVDRINLDAYLPGAEQRAGAPEQPSGAAGEAAEQPQGTEAAASAGLAFLADFDANLDLKVGALTYQGLAFNGVRLDATLQQGGLVVREASLTDLAGSGGRFSGSLANVAREPTFDGSLDLSVTSLSRLIKAVGLPSQGQLPLEAFTLSGAVNGNRQLVRFDQSLSTLGGRLHAAGKADLSQGPPLVDAAVDVAHPDLTVLLRELMPGEKIPGGLGAVDLKGQLAGDPQSLELTALAGKVAGVDLEGDLALALGGERPKITANLRSGALPLAALAAPAAAAGSKKAGTGSKTPADGGARKPASRSERWSSEPIDISALRRFDADVTLQLAAIVLDETTLRKANLEAALNDGLLVLKRFSATAYGGALSVIGKADAREGTPGGLAVSAAVTAIEVDLKALLKDLGDTDRISGPVNLESNLNAVGLSEAALVGSLNGQGKIDGTVTVAAKAEEQAGALLLGVLGKKVKEIRGLTDSTALLFGAFAGAASKVDGTFVVEQGVVTTEDTRVRGRTAEALTAATINLPTWQMNSQTDVFRDSDPQTAYLTAKLRGSLDSPDININGQAFQRREEAPAGGAESPAVPQEGTDSPASQPKPPKPEDILKEGLKGLLKGLGG